MRIKDIMVSPVITVPTDATYVEAALILYTNHITGAPVVSSDGHVIGVVSEKDLYRILYPWYQSYYLNPEEYVDFETRESKASDIRDHRVETFMTAPVITTHPDTPLLRAGAIMLAKHIHRLPVIEKDHLVGIVTRGELYRRIIQTQLERNEQSS